MRPWFARDKSPASRTSLTAPIAPGESIIAPRTDSSASRFCGGTGASRVDEASTATSELVVAGSADFNGWTTVFRTGSGRTETWPLAGSGNTRSSDCPQPVGCHPQLAEHDPRANFALPADSSSIRPQAGQKPVEN